MSPFFREMYDPRVEGPNAKLLAHIARHGFRLRHDLARAELIERHRQMHPDGIPSDHPEV